LISVAVVCLPAESTIVKVSGLTHVPFVIASKNLPLAETVELTSVTPVGKVDATV
jgi:hypothetical protein